MNRLTQKQMILQHLMTFGRLTSLTALMEYGCSRLSDVIYDLRQSGWDIKTNFVKSYSRFTGKMKRYAEYELVSKSRKE